MSGWCSGLVAFVVAVPPVAHQVDHEVAADCFRYAIASRIAARHASGRPRSRARWNVEPLGEIAGVIGRPRSLGSVVKPLRPLIIIHCDAASAQGVVAKHSSARWNGYGTGGTVHIIQNTRVSPPTPGRRGRPITPAISPRGSTFPSCT